MSDITRFTAADRRRWLFTSVLMAVGAALGYTLIEVFLQHETTYLWITVPLMIVVLTPLYYLGYSRSARRSGRGRGGRS